MIMAANKEIYIRPFPTEGELLDEDLYEAASRGLSVKYISMGYPASIFEFQVVHPEIKKVEESWGGRLIDLVRDREEALVGVFRAYQEEKSLINWSKNECFVTSTRDSLRNDSYHYFLHKIYELNQPLTEKEKTLYQLIRDDL